MPSRPGDHYELDTVGRLISAYGVACHHTARHQMVAGMGPDVMRSLGTAAAQEGTLMDHELVG